MVQLIFRNAGRFVLEKGNCLIVRGRVLIGILSIDGAKNVHHMGSILIRVLESVFDSEFLTLSVIPVIANERNRSVDVLSLATKPLCFCHSWHESYYHVCKDLKNKTIG